MRHLVPRVALMILLLGVLALGVSVSARALPFTSEIAMRGESVFTDATDTVLAAGSVPAFPSTPAEIGLQRVHIAPGGTIVTPGDDPRVVLVSVEQGTLTVRNTVPVLVTRLTQDQDAIPAETTYTMTTGDAYVSPPGSGGELRNEGTDEVILLAAIIWPVPAATPTPEG